jgi:hypothetical protein
MRRAGALALVAAAMVVLGCREATAPIEVLTLPPRDWSLDPDRVRVGELVAVPCAVQGANPIGLPHLEGQHRRALLDFYFGRSLEDHGPPTDHEVSLVTSAGGQVVHRFNAPVVRGWIPLSSVIHVVQNGYWVTVRAVPDPSRYDLTNLGVQFNRPINDEYYDLYRELGGVVTGFFPAIMGVSANLPDHSVPVLAAREDVELMFINASAYCLD